MCGPSDKLKAINTTIQDFSKQVTAEAGQIFGAANTVFNNIMNATQSIVAGGASQQGESAAELNAQTAANVQSTAGMARNLKGAAASSVAAIGGGNSANPAGLSQEVVQGAETSAAAQEASTQNKIVQNDWALGRQNFFSALGAEEAAPGVYNAANAANQVAGAEQKVAETSQQNIDTQGNWWKSLLLKVGTSVLQGPQMPSMGGMSGGSQAPATSGASGSDQGSDSGTMNSDSGSMGGGGDAGGAVAA
jgi:hypothetical protein